MTAQVGGGEVDTLTSSEDLSRAFSFPGMMMCTHGLNCRATSLAELWFFVTNNNNHKKDVSKPCPIIHGKYWQKPVM